MGWLTFGSSKKIKKDKTADKGRHSLNLADIIRGLQYCVNSSQQVTEWHHINTIEKFFVTKDIKDGKEVEADIKKRFLPVTQQIKINETAAMDVPLISLVDHTSLILDEIEVNLSLFVKNTELISHNAMFSSASAPITEEMANGNIDRASFDIDLTSAKPDNDKTRMDIKLKYKSEKPPEAISRIIEKLNDQVRIYALDPKTGLPPTDTNDEKLS